MALTDIQETISWVTFKIFSFHEALDEMTLAIHLLAVSSVAVSAITISAVAIPPAIAVS